MAEPLFCAMTDLKNPIFHAPKGEGKDIRNISISIETVGLCNKNVLQRYKNIFRNKPSVPKRSEEKYYFKNIISRIKRYLYLII